MAKFTINKFNIPSKFEEKFKGTSIEVTSLSGDEMEISFYTSEEHKIIKDLLREVYGSIGDIKSFNEFNNRLILASRDNVPRKLFCYSQSDFNSLMEDNGWFMHPGINTATVSIVSYNLDEYGIERYYHDDWNNNGIMSNFNLDVDDISPFWWETKENELYDNTWAMFEDYRATGNKSYLDKSNAFFNYFRTLNDDTPQVLHAMNCDEAYNLMRYIDEKIEKNKVSEFYVHCEAGVSRSQAVVRYILDTYFDYKWKIREDNPPQTPNVHILSMLKRAYRLTHK